MSRIRITPAAVVYGVAPVVPRAKWFSVVYNPAGAANRARALAWGILSGSCAIAGSLVSILSKVRDIFRLASAAGLMFIGIISFALARYYGALARPGKPQVPALSQPPDTFRYRKE